MKRYGIHTQTQGSSWNADTGVCLHSSVTRGLRLFGSSSAVRQHAAGTKLFRQGNADPGVNEQTVAPI